MDGVDQQGNPVHRGSYYRRYIHKQHRRTGKHFAFLLSEEFCDVLRLYCYGIHPQTQTRSCRERACILRCQGDRYRLEVWL